MEKRYQVIKPAHCYYKGECLDTDIAPTIDTGIGCWHTLIGESMEEIKCEQVGMLSGDSWDKCHEANRRVYSSNGLAPTITTMGGGRREPKIIEPIIYDDYNDRIRADQDCIGTLTTNCGNDALRNGVKIIEPVIVDEIYNNREPRVYREHCPTIRAERQGLEVVEPICLNSKVDGKQPSLTDRVYDTDGISTCVTTSPFFMGNIAEPTAYDEQNGYLRQDGCVGTLTTDGSSPKHNNRIVEPNSEQDEFDMGIIYELSKTYRIRKLTERECFRLMGVKESDFERVAKNQSMSALYHEAGDSIVTTCLMAILGVLFGVDYQTKINELVEELKQ